MTEFKNKIGSFFSALCLRVRHFGFLKSTEGVVTEMNPAEKALFYGLCLILAISAIVLALRVQSVFLVEVPAFGGGFSEGIVGSPRFINPVLTISEADKDLVALIYSGLLRVDQRGGMSGDLANGYKVDEGGLVYELEIREGARFHDGEAVTADDVIFTIGKVLDPIIKSPKASSWEGVRVEKVSDREVRFILSKPYAPFLQALTLGILPKHIWENATSEELPFSQFNINPIGSGPYKVDKIERNSGGLPVKITLEAWQNYALGRPKIKTITFQFFQNESELVKAYKTDVVDSMVGFGPEAAANLNQDLTKDSTLPRVFGVFFNQNNAPVFLNKEVRAALDLATPKQKIISSVIGEFGQILNGPTPQDIENEPQRIEGDLEEAKEILLRAGWELTEEGLLEKKTKAGQETLSFALTTSDAPELKQTAEFLEEAWEKLGAQVQIKVFEAGDLSQNIIKGRKYEALLFGEVVSNGNDLYSFWHSSGRIDPGLNIALYANITVDKALEEMQTENDPANLALKKEVVVKEIQNDLPAVFLFSPSLLYAPPSKIKNLSLKDVSYQNERFLFIKNWFIETDKVWKIFSDYHTN